MSLLIRLLFSQQVTVAMKGYISGSDVMQECRIKAVAKSVGGASNLTFERCKIIQEAHRHRVVDQYYCSKMKFDEVQTV